MKHVISGEFIMNGYYGFEESESRVRLGSMLEAAFPKGTVVNLTITIEKEGNFPTCESDTKYGHCGQVLNNDGSCPSENQHVKAEIPEEITA